MSESPTLNNEASQTQEDFRDHFQGDEVDFVDFFLIVAEYWKAIVFVPLVAAAFAYGLTYVLPKEYSAIARVTPPLQVPSLTSALASQLGSIAALAGASGTVTNPSETLAAMAASQTVLDAIIGKFKLKDLYKERTVLQKLYKDWTLVQTRKDLLDSIKISASTDDGLVTVEVLDRDPKLAADIANAFVEELTKLTKAVTASEAKNRRVLYEAEVNSNRGHLADAEIRLKKIQEASGLINLDSQARAIIESIATLRAGIVSKEVEIAAMRTFATDRNPAYRRELQELKGLQAELKKMEATNSAGEGNLFVSAKGLPEAGLEVLRAVRDVKLYETMAGALETQLALARIDEIREPSIVQVVDSAVVMDEETRPYRKTIAAAVFVLAAIATIFCVFARKAITRYRSVPTQAAKYERLVSFLRWKSDC